MLNISGLRRIGKSREFSVMLGIIVLTLPFLSISPYVLHLSNANAQNNDNTTNK